MVNIFGDEQLKHDMKTDNLLLRGQKPPKAGPQELVIKSIMDKKWEECSPVFAFRLSTTSHGLDTIIIHFILVYMHWSHFKMLFVPNTDNVNIVND